MGRVDRLIEQWRGLTAVTAHGGAPLAVLEKLARVATPLSGPVGRLQRLAAERSDVRARAFDREHGTDTFSRAPMSELGCRDDSGKDFDGWMYGPINQDFFDEIAQQVTARHELMFCDVGMGKGLALMLADRWGFGSLVGVELSSPLVDIARVNFEKYRASGKPFAAEAICADFMEYALPDKPTLFFLNNPFPHYIAERAVAHILKSITTHPRRVVVVYRKAPSQTQALLDASPLLMSERWTPYWKIWRSAG